MQEIEPTPRTEPPVPRRRNRSATALVGTAAIAAMLLVGLGVAGAQTEDAPPSAPPAGEDAPNDQEPGARDRNCRRQAGTRLGLGVAARVIGIEVEALRAALTEGDGKSVAQVARNNGVEPAKVIGAIVAEAKTRLEAKVAAGDLSREKADLRLKALETRVSAAIERPVERLGEGCARHRCHDGHHAEAGYDPGDRNAADQPGVSHS